MASGSYERALWNQNRLSSRREPNGGIAGGAEATDTSATFFSPSLNTPGSSMDEDDELDSVGWGAGLSPALRVMTVAIALVKKVSYLTRKTRENLSVAFHKKTRYIDHSRHYVPQVDDAQNANSCATWQENDRMHAGS